MATSQEITPVPAGASSASNRVSWPTDAEGDPDALSLFAGQSVGLVPKPQPARNDRAGNCGGSQIHASYEINPPASTERPERWSSGSWPMLRGAVPHTAADVGRCHEYLLLRVNRLRTSMS
jgi:hypothetical protein